MSDAAQIKDEPCYLYRHFDATGVLLYVGISLSAINRLKEHKVGSHWFESIKQVSIETFPTRSEALLAEKKAISAENPKHNIQGRRSLKIEEAIAKAFAYQQNNSLPHQRTRDELIRRTVSMQLVYRESELVDLLNIGLTAVRRLMDSGELGFVILPSKRGGFHGQRVATGWQVIDYIEHVASKTSKKIRSA